MGFKEEGFGSIVISVGRIGKKGDNWVGYGNKGKRGRLVFSVELVFLFVVSVGGVMGRRVLFCYV